MDLALKLMESLVTQGPLVAFLFYLHVKNEKALEKKEQENQALNKELRAALQANLEKLHEIIVNNSNALNAIREAFRNA